MGRERTPPALITHKPVLSPCRITLENNGKIRPQPDRENAFARSGGGGSQPGTQLSLASEAAIADLSETLRAVFAADR